MLARVVFAAIGLTIAVLGPRYPQAALTGLGILLALLVGAISMALTGGSVAAAALSLAGLVLVAVALARLFPRAMLVPLLVITMASSAGTLLAGHFPEPRPARIAIGICLLLLLVALTARPRIGLRVLTALLAAMLTWGVGPLAKPSWAFALTAAALLLASNFTERETEPLPWRALAAPTAILGVLVGASVLAGMLAPVPTMPNQPRLDQLAQLAPEGGILWPLPSEAMAWKGTVEPAFTNLDALYLGGSGDAVPAQVPGTSIWGRFALNGPVHRLRAIKEPGEVEKLRQASQATVKALLDSLPLFRVGGSEATIAAAIQEGYRRHGCSGESFPPIVASGKNALDPHYFDNNATLAEGDVVVVDIGCYVDHYASDFTRVIPVGGHFTPRARALYATLEQSALFAEAACRPGAWMFSRSQKDGADTTAMMVDRQLKDATGQERMPHGLGHPLGLFVHDVFDWSAPLGSGMVVMIEPGVYLKDEGIGLRLEDAYLVTPTGCERLTTGFPTNPDAVERLTTAALAGAR